MGGIQFPCPITGHANFPRPRKLWGESPGTLSVSLWIPVSFHALFFRKLQGGVSSPWRRVLMALISAWFLSSSATLALASTKLSSSFRTWASAFICSGRMHSVGKWGGPGKPSLLPTWVLLVQPLRLPPLVLLECCCLGNPPIHRLWIYQHKSRACGLAQPLTLAYLPFIATLDPCRPHPIRKYSGPI